MSSATDNKVSVRPVKLGPTDGDLSQVTGGLKAGERVVIDGADRLKDGAAVMVPDARPGKAGGWRGSKGPTKRRKSAAELGR